MGGIDKFLNSAEKKGTITIIKTNKKKGIINKKTNEWKSITIDTEYFLKTGIKRELKNDKTLKKKNGWDRKKWAKEYYNKKYKIIKSDEEKEVDRKTAIERNKIKCLRQYYKNRDERKLVRKLRYQNNIEKEREKYKNNREYFINKSKDNYKKRKFKEKTRQYFKKNILPLINNASIKE
jgi:hypothetical protein